MNTYGTHPNPLVRTAVRAIAASGIPVDDDDAELLAQEVVEALRGYFDAHHQHFFPGESS